MYLVSIIVPIFNVVEQLPRCVESIINQTYSNIEIILVDDGSNDGSEDFCDYISKKDNRIKAIHKKNAGLSSARNKGIELATGDYIFFVDSDDYLDINAIKILLENAKKTNADLVVSGYEDIFPGNHEEKHYCSKAFLDYDGFWSNYFNSKEKTLFTLPWNKLYRSSLFETCYFEEGKINEDEFIIEKIISQCNIIVFVTDILYFYVHRNESITSSALSYKNFDAVDALQSRITAFINKNKINYALKTMYIIPGLSSRIFVNITDFEEEKVKERFIQIKKVYKKQFWLIIRRRFDMHLLIQSIVFFAGPVVYEKVINRRLTSKRHN